MTNSHLAILKKPYLDAILAGEKTVESRFTKTRRPPFGCIAAGDKVLFKVSSGAVCAVGLVSKVVQFAELTPGRIKQIKNKYNKYVLGSEQYWYEKADSKYGTLIWLEKIEAIEAVRINKKDWRAWVVLTAKQNFGLFEKLKQRQDGRN